MDIVGFARISSSATTCRGALNPSEFIGRVCRVLEFDSEGGVLCLNPEGTALAMFEKADISAKFECTVFGIYICPPKQNILDNMSYATKCMTRKGGYNNILQGMVIKLSLAKGSFNDNFLWQQQ